MTAVTPSPFRARLNAAAAALIGPADLSRADLGPVWLPNGYYTLTLPCGTHRTFRLYTQQKGELAGKRIIGLLIGPDNTADYEDFAFVMSAGPKVWKRFANQRQAELLALVWDIARGEALDGHELKIDKRCIACNRVLTTPESIDLGYGPVCAGRLGK
jgi:hypothetical protein